MSYVETDTLIYKTDDQPISDEEIPHLIQNGLDTAIEKEKTSNNIKFHRTKKEEELSFQFMIKHNIEIQERIDAFENCCSLAYKEKNLDKKIELLQQTIQLYEKFKNWFYRTKGGMIYFQDMYEYMHNSRNEVFSYIDSVNDELENCLEERDYTIPNILKLISSNNGILQKDIYQYLTDIDRSEIQRIVKNLESANIISKTKKGNSYFLQLVLDK